MHLSLAQQLPVEILQHIVTVLSQPALNQRQEPTVASSLLSTCRLWRAASLPIYSSCVTVCPSADRKRSYRARKGLSPSKALYLGWSKYVRRVTVMTFAQATSANNIQKELLTIGGVLPNVTRVYLHILGSIGSNGALQQRQTVEGLVDVSPIIASLGSAFSGLRHIELSASNVSLVDETRADPMGITTEHVRRLYEMIVCADLCHCPVVQLSSAFAPNLATLVLELPRTNTELTINMARTHASTLQTLAVKYIDASDSAKLTWYADGSPVVYRRLRHLALGVIGAYGGSNGEMQIRMPVSEACFPALVYVNCGDYYPFSNSSLISSSRATLQRLTIAVDTGMKEWLFPKDGVALLSSFEQLAEIEVRIITHSPFLNSQTLEIQAWLLQQMVNMPQIRWLRIRYPNFIMSEYIPMPRRK